MPEFTERIQRVTADLQRILQELDPATHTAHPATRERLSRELLVPGVIRDFKTVVDDMRHMIWSYIEADSSKDSAQNVQTKLQALRMQRVTDMLKTLQPDVSRESTAALPEATTFFELIHNIAHNTVDRHQGP